MRSSTRRSCLASVLALALAPAVHAQSPTRLRRIGRISWDRNEADMRRAPWFQQFVEGLSEQGLVEGRDYAFELRFIAGRSELYEPMARELVAAHVDVMWVNICGLPLDAVRHATQTIPIVVSVCNDDLVDLGIIRSLAHPGGNLTGVTKLTPELAPKRLQLLLQVVPRARRIAVLWNPAYAEFKSDWRELRGAAAKVGVALLPVEFRSGDELDAAFHAMTSQRADAMMVFSDYLVYALAPRVAKLALQHRLPGMFAFREVPDGGGLMSYGPSIPGLFRQSARLVARVLRGDRPADLPVEQASRFELVINLKTAKTLGITVPQELLLQTDEVIE